MKETFRAHVVETNLRRLVLMSGFIILLSVYFLVADLTMAPPEKAEFTATWYRPMDMALPVLGLGCLALTLWASRKEQGSRSRAVVMYAVPAVFAGWFSAVSGLELYSMGSSATIVAVLYAVAAVFLLRPHVYLLYLAGALMVFYGTATLPGELEKMPFEMLMVLPGTVVISTVLSAIMYGGRASAYVDGRRLKETAERLEEEVRERRSAQRELEGARAALERDVRATTGELHRANRMLLEEIRRHRSSETQCRELESQLRQAQKLESIGRLAGGVAHDFNNLLSPIIAYSDLLLADAEEGSEAWKSLQRIRSAGQQAARMTRQLLAFSRSQVLDRKPARLQVVLDEIAPMLERMIGERYRLEMDVAEGLPAAMVDKSMIGQVVLNLVINARDAMPDGGRILIRLRADGESEEGKPRLALSVIDQGTGMDEETADRIFEPFFTTKESGKGTGLGLAMVHGIVKQHEGDIELHTKPGRGSTFTVFLPASPRPATTEHEEPGTPPRPTGREQVLVAEDEEVVRKLVVEILTSAGYRVLAASSPREALELSDSTPGGIDLLLSDVVMPDMGGFELCSRLRKDRGEMPVLFMSGYSYEAGRPEAADKARTCFIAKPFTAGELLRQVRTALEKGPA
ncbi:MAG: ATP-binding protein [Candidatus Fermentibacteraceae bacterium]